MSTLVTTLLFALILLLPALLLRFFIRRLHPGWWRVRALRIASGLLCILAPVGALTLIIPYRQDLTPLVSAGYTWTLLVLIWEAMLIVLLPLTAGLRWLLARVRRPGEPARPDLSRRRFVKVGLAALPAGALTLSGAGIVEAALPTRVPLLLHKQPGLPPELAGLRILLISDLHLAIFVTLGDLGAILEEASALRPDLILVTGDIADDLRLLTPALDMIRDFRAPLGAWACLGNHEHVNGLTGALAGFEGHEVQLLVNRTASLTHGGRSFSLSGVDDPAVGTGELNQYDFNRRMLAEAFPGAKEEQAEGREREFRLLMSHRPLILDVAGEYGVDLVLAGHTHGGHAAILGNSQLELRGKHPYPWGFYKQGDSRLYTTSGAGQWIPFRFGCRAEAPVIELHPA